MKLLLSVTLLAATFMANPALAYKYIWEEAESGAEYNPIVVKSGRNLGQAIYLAPWRSSDYSNRSVDDGLITFDLYVPETGTYKLWARTKFPGTGVSPYYISMDGTGDVYDNSQWANWATETRPNDQATQWGWSNAGYSRSLTAGTHTLRLLQKMGGPGVQIDKILLTNDTNFVPTGTGENEPVLDIINPYKSASVEKYGQLKVVGSQLSDKNGNPVQLKGISTHGLQWFPLADRQTIPNMAQFFGADVVRLAMYIEDYAPTDNTDYWGGYKADALAQKARAFKAIDDAIAAGVYVMVDWHIHNVPSNYTSDAIAFFKEVATKYGAYPNIIYEICNEPVGVSWGSNIKPYAEAVISAIRASDPDNIIVIGTPNWSQDVDAASQNPVRTTTNLMYSLHYYAATHDINIMKNKVITAMNAGIAVFVSEWGSSDVGTSRSNFSAAQQWMQFMNEKKLSWINWSLGNKDEASSILKAAAPVAGPWTAADLTTAGSWIKPYFNAPQAATGSSSNTTTPPATTTPPPATTTTNTATTSVHCAVTENVWTGGYQSNITITNKTSTTLNNWKITATLGAADSFSQGWGANISASGKIVTISSMSPLAANQSVSVGIQGNTAGVHSKTLCQ